MGGKFTLSAIYRLKSPESGDKGGVMGYQNSSWDIWDPIKKVLGPKNFWVRARGLQSSAAGKFDQLKICIFFTLNQNLRPKTREMK